MVSKSSIAEIKSMKEGFLKEKAELERKIDVIDTVLKIFEKDDPENCSTGIRKIEKKDPDIEKKREYQRKAYKRWYDKQKALKQEKINPDIEVEKGTDIPRTRETKKINYDDMG